MIVYPSLTAMDTTNMLKYMAFTQVARVRFPEWEPEIFGVATNICSFMSQAMLLWHTRLRCGGKTLGTVNIKCGIFQGDSFFSFVIYNMFVTSYYI